MRCRKLAPGTYTSLLVVVVVFLVLSESSSHSRQSSFFFFAFSFPFLFILSQSPLTSSIFLSCCGSSILSTVSTAKCLKRFGFILCTFDSDLVGKVGAGFLACKILFLSVFRCLHTRVVWSLSRSVLRHGWRWQQ